MSPEQAADPLVNQFSTDLKKIITTRVDGEAGDERQRQLRRLDKADNYYRGNQYLSEEYNSASGTLGWSPTGSPRTGGDLDTSGVLDYVIDLVKSYGRKYYGVLGTRPFHNAKAVPDDPQNDADRAASRQYELGAIYLKNKWNARVMNIMVFYHQWKAGNVYAYVDHVADKAMWGETTEPIMTEKTVEMEPAGYRCTTCGAKSPEPQILPIQDPMTGESIEQSVCPECSAPLSDIHFEPAQTAQVPDQTGEKKYPNAGPRLTLYTGYQVTVPQDTVSLDRAAWLDCSLEEHPGALLQLYREQLKDKINDKGELEASTSQDESGDAQEEARRSRHSAASISGQRESDKCKRWTYSRLWLSPFMFEYIQNEAKREESYEKFPDGVKITRVQGHIVKLEPEAITDSWSVFEPEPGDVLYKDPVCYGILGHQDITNDMANLMVSILERVLPAMAFDPDIIDGAAISDGSGRTNEMIPAKSGTSGRLEAAFAKIPTASFPDHAPQLMGLIEANLQSYTGLQPSVYGGGEKTETAEQARIQLSQALMQLAVPGEFAGVGWKSTLDIALRKIKKYGLKAAAVPTGKDTSELFSADALQDGSAHFENEFGVPMSWGERRDQLNHIIGQNPALAHALGLDAPMNIPVVRDFLLPGMEELMVPGEERREKVVEAIRELLKEAPIGDQPSILPEPFVDDAMDAVMVVDWLRSDAGRSEKRKNPAGYQNVVAFGMAMAMLPPPIGTPPPMMDPGAEGGPPPPSGKPPKQDAPAAGELGGNPMPPAQTI